MREIKTIKGTKLTRDKNYKIGKRVGNDIYFHKDYINEFNFTNEIRKKIALIPINYNFNIIRFNLKNRDASFINSPNFI